MDVDTLVVDVMGGFPTPKIMPTTYGQTKASPILHTSLPEDNFGWKKANLDKIKLTMPRPMMNMVVGVEEKGDSNLIQFIDPSMLILDDSSKETNQDILLTTRNGMLDFYRATKGSFHELKEVNLKIRALERKAIVHEETAKAREHGIDKDNTKGRNTR